MEAHTIVPMSLPVKRNTKVRIAGIATNTSIADPSMASISSNSHHPRQMVPAASARQTSTWNSALFQA